MFFLHRTSLNTYDEIAEALRTAYFDQELVEVRLDNVGPVYRTRIVEPSGKPQKRIAAVNLAPLEPELPLDDLYDAERIEFRFARGKEILTGESVFLRTPTLAGRSWVQLRFPRRLTIKPLRGGERTPVPAGFEVRAAVIRDGRMLYEAKVVNVGGGGLMFETPAWRDPLRRGEVLDLEVYDPTKRLIQPLRAQGQVTQEVRVRRADGGAAVNVAGIKISKGGWGVSRAAAALRKVHDKAVHRIMDRINGVPEIDL
ncbi:MAG: hypothetical protein HQL51_05000 [Magnetococcales bacterium]|nr:hypothetical protein [Magnetococcales bacterium]